MDRGIFFEKSHKNGWNGINNGKIVFRAGASSNTQEDSALKGGGSRAP